MNLTDYMAGKGKEFTNPGLDLKVYRHQFHDCADKKLYQLPDQCSPAFTGSVLTLRARPERTNKAKYGCDLGVPLNWSAYEDIAAFFSADQDHRRQADLRPHGLRQEGPIARLALHRAVVDGRNRRYRHPERQTGGRMGHPHHGRQLHATGSLGAPGARQLPALFTR
jgi:hypothetical protein